MRKLKIFEIFALLCVFGLMACGGAGTKADSDAATTISTKPGDSASSDQAPPEQEPKKLDQKQVSLNVQKFAFLSMYALEGSYLLSPSFACSGIKANLAKLGVEKWDPPSGTITGSVGQASCSTATNIADVEYQITFDNAEIIGNQTCNGIFIMEFIVHPGSGKASIVLDQSDLVVEGNSYDFSKLVVSVDGSKSSCEGTVTVEGKEFQINKDCAVEKAIDSAQKTNPTA